MGVQEKERRQGFLSRVVFITFLDEIEGTLEGPIQFYIERPFIDWMWFGTLLRQHCQDRMRPFLLRDLLLPLRRHTPSRNSRTFLLTHD